MTPLATMLSRWWHRAAGGLRRLVGYPRHDASARGGRDGRDVPGAGGTSPATAAATRPGFTAARFTHATGTRDYKLYVPAGRTDGPRPLVVMLHGCTQDPDDFAVGTRMNALADRHGLLVLYPAQPPRSNAAKCWNWFEPRDQRRGDGEPALLAALVRDVVGRADADPDRVHVAGLSAGGAMAAILSREYPDVFAAAAVHAGLPQGAAHDTASAFAVMHTGRLRPGRRSRSGGPGIPTLVFHGDADRTVHPANGQHVVDDVVADPAAQPVIRRGEAAGRPYTHTVYPGRDGRPFVEHWEVHGLGHAWSGGDPRGSHTDPRGPDASHESVRFFALHRRRVPA